MSKSRMMFWWLSFRESVSSCLKRAIAFSSEISRVNTLMATFSSTRCSGAALPARVLKLRGLQDPHSQT